MPTDKRARQRAARAQKQAVIQRKQKRSTQLRRVLTFGALAAVIILIVVAIQSSGGAKKPAATGTGHSITTLKSGTSSPTTPTASTFPVPVTQPLTSVPVAPTCPPVAGSSRRVVLFSHAPPDCIGKTSVLDATFQTSIGDFVVRMDAAKSYAAVNNFVFLARWQYYNGTFFHRIIQGFMDQGGDPAGTGSGGATGAGVMKYGYPGYEFTGNTPPSSCVAKKDCYATGDVAMANTGKPTSNGGQFFVIVPGGGAQLTPNYSDFGHVTSGLSVVEKINSYGASTASGQTGTPTVKIYLLKVTITQVSA